jgi:hypothetical protein
MRLFELGARWSHLRAANRDCPEFPQSRVKHAKTIRPWSSLARQLWERDLILVIDLNPGKDLGSVGRETSGAFTSSVADACRLGTQAHIRQPGAKQNWRIRQLPLM